MIENHRNEDLCRRWDALADEEHTHHLTAQEYLYYKSKWWLHSNKQGSNVANTSDVIHVVVDVFSNSVMRNRLYMTETQAHVGYGYCGGSTHGSERPLSK